MADEFGWCQRQDEIYIFRLCSRLIEEQAE